MLAWFFYQYHPSLSLLIYIKSVLWPHGLQGFYCCQSLTTLSEITSGSKVKTTCKIWPLLVFFNNVCMYIHIHACLQSFLNSCSIFQPAWSHIAELTPVSIRTWEWTRSWGRKYMLTFARHGSLQKPALLFSCAFAHLSLWHYIVTFQTASMEIR